MPLPYISDNSLRTGGLLKVEPRFFLVHELPLYEADGAGEHLYVNLTREGWNTADLVRKISGILGKRFDDLGYAGLKDKHAVATQTISIYAPQEADDAELIRKITENLPVQVEWFRRHGNKLKTGHLRANQFEITLSDVDPNALSLAEKLSEELLRKGYPNYYGEQRFGRSADNAEQGKRILLGKKRETQKWKRNLLLSAYQSELFNQWLGERILAGDFTRILKGDVAKKNETGGLFDVDFPEAEQVRFDSGEITYTGPMFGSKMRPALFEAGEREAAVLARENVKSGKFAGARLEGSRRAALIRPEDFSIASVPEGLKFKFTLPKGAYATALMREFIKGEH